MVIVFIVLCLMISILGYFLYTEEYKIYNLRGILITLIIMITLLSIVFAKSHIFNIQIGNTTEVKDSNYVEIN